jgi:hypothetical protein
VIKEANKRLKMVHDGDPHGAGLKALMGIADLLCWIYNRIYRKGGFSMKTLIVLPDELGAELKHSIPARQRSRFVAEAVEKQLRSMKFKKGA